MSGSRPAETNDRHFTDAETRRIGGQKESLAYMPESASDSLIMSATLNPMIAR